MDVEYKGWAKFDTDPVFPSFGLFLDHENAVIIQNEKGTFFKRVGYAAFYSPPDASVWTKVAVKEVVIL